ncbi:hypothetical protein Pcinc_008007 [Petrolisthes cinctipes]|uniref:Apple domain-containing protein n=1 Tax=Petrolisthes cinctipes TaxID=88211 RepID=A0AAE1G7H5_PETCI|nr:hypothetical protein Pcinc_008007 [Petrolisthes cinctipes]
MAVMVATKEEPIEPILPDIWTVVQDSYDSRVSVSFPKLTPHVSMMVDELYDISDEMGMLQVWDHSQVTHINYYSKSNQSFIVKDDTCTVGGIKPQDPYRLFGWLYDAYNSTEGDVNNFLYGPSALLRIVRDYERQVEYIGEAEVRGIIANHWTLEHRLGYIIDYYFAADEWLMPYGHTFNGKGVKQPLRVKVEGMEGNPWDVNMADIAQSITYDFTEFKPYVDPARRKNFLVRSGVDCPQRATLDTDMITPPSAPGRFQVFFENILSQEHVHEPSLIFRSWMYFDSWSKLLRLDINPDMDATLGGKVFKSIQDYNTGIEYVIQENGKCSMYPIQPHQLGNMIGSSAAGGIIMSDANGLFYLDDKYVFSGYTETRGLKTTRWTSTRDDIYNPETQQNFKKVVVDYQFTAPGVILDGEREGTTMPIRADFTVYHDDNTSAVLTREVLNLLHMQSSFEIYEFNPFHVGECFDTPTQRTWIKLTFAGDWHHGAAQSPGLFKKDLINQLAIGTGSSYIRFPEVELDHDLEFVWATVLLLEPAPYHLQFYKLEDRKPSVNDARITFNIADEDVCAYQCPHILKIRVQTQKGEYIAIGEVEEILGDDPILVDLLASDFHVAHKHGRLLNGDVDLTLKQESYVSCLASCDVMASFECETFSYCYDSAKCFLSSKIVNIPVANGDIISQTDCIIVTRSHTDDYSVLDGTVYLGQPTQSNITANPERCAYLCDTVDTFTCRSFDYCYSDLGCNLYDQHTVDAPDNMFNYSAGNCLHYSRQAMVDFEKHPNQVLEGSRDRYVKDITVYNCAQVCEDEPDLGCNGFDFCTENNGTTCFLTSDHYSDSGVDISNSPVCDHYSREYYEGQDRNSYAHNKNSKYKYSPGDMAALGCSMLVISMALTFAGVYFYNKR